MQEDAGVQGLTRRAATAALPSSLSSSSSSSLHSHPPSSVLWRRPLEPGTRRTYVMHLRKATLNTDSSDTSLILFRHFPACTSLKVGHTLNETAHLGSVTQEATQTVNLQMVRVQCISEQCQTFFDRSVIVGPFCKSLSCRYSLFCNGKITFLRGSRNILLETWRNISLFL